MSPELELVLSSAGLPGERHLLLGTFPARSPLPSPTGKKDRSPGGKELISATVDWLQDTRLKFPKSYRKALSSGRSGQQCRLTVYVTAACVFLFLHSTPPSPMQALRFLLVRYFLSRFTSPVCSGQNRVPPVKRRSSPAPWHRECDLMWRRDLCSCDRAKVRSRWSRVGPGSREPGIPVRGEDTRRHAGKEVV